MRLNGSAFGHFIESVIAPESLSAGSKPFHELVEQVADLGVLRINLEAGLRH
jgi:hypothetical protein